MEINFVDAPSRHRNFWLVHEAGVVDVCLKPPGFATDLVVSTRVRILAEVWRGIRPLSVAIRAGDIRLAGKAALRRSFPKWLLLSAYARIPGAR